MFVPVIPIVPNTTIVNKTIVYSDTVLNIKEYGSNLKISSISDVTESELVKCLKIIFDNNKGVIFNTIQYSRGNNKIYFYTDKEVNINAWENFKINTFERLNSSEILNEVKNIFLQDVNNDKDCISLYKVAYLMKEMKKKYDNLKDNYEYSLENGNHIIIYDFDYNTSELIIGISFLGKIYDIYFSKQDDDLYITKSEYYDNQTILNNLGNKLSILYDEFIKFKDFKTVDSYGIKTVNSIFYSNVSSLEVSFFSAQDSKGVRPIFNNGFEVTSYNYSSDYGCKCNSVNTLNVIKNNEEELFKRIFVKIEDMPNWSQDALYEIRKEEFEIKQEKNKIKRLKDKFRNFISRNF